MRGKGQVERKHELRVPGPGRYDVTTKPVEAEITYGYTFGSRDSSEGSKRKNKNKKLPPGPGEYSIRPMMATTKGFAFSVEQRPNIIGKSKKNPGPGAYSTVRDGAWFKPPYCRFP